MYKVIEFGDPFGWYYLAGRAVSILGVEYFADPARVYSIGPYLRRHKADRWFVAFVGHGLLLVGVLWPVRQKRSGRR